MHPGCTSAQGGKTVDLVAGCQRWESVCSHRCRVIRGANCGSVRGTLLLAAPSLRLDDIPSRNAVQAWIGKANLTGTGFLFPSRLRDSTHLSTRQYSRIVAKWVSDIGCDPTAYGTHSLRRTKASLIYRRIKNRRAVQLLLGHSKLESTVRYLGIEVDDALELAENTEV